MTEMNMDLSELPARHDQGDLLRGMAEAVSRLIMETDVDGLIGAGRHERNGDRTTWRNGYRDRAIDTRPGTTDPPKPRQGGCFPGFPEARKTSKQALVAVIEEAWIGGVSTRRVDEPVQAMGLRGISTSTVSKLCKDIDERGGEFLNRPLNGERLIALHVGYRAVEPWSLKRIDTRTRDALTGAGPRAILKSDRAAGTVTLDPETALTGLPDAACLFCPGMRWSGWSLKRSGSDVNFAETNSKGGHCHGNVGLRFAPT